MFDMEEHKGDNAYLRQNKDINEIDEAIKNMQSKRSLNDRKSAKL